MSHGRTLSSIAILSSLRDYSLQLHAEDIRVTHKKIKHGSKELLT